MKTSEQYIQNLADEFELPVDKVALVWSVYVHLILDYSYPPKEIQLYFGVKQVIEELFTK